MINQGDISFIVDGEAVDDEVLNRPTKELIPLINAEIERVEGPATALAGGGTLEFNSVYHIGDNGTYVFPDVTGVVTYKWIRLSKYKSVTPLLEVDGTNSELFTSPPQEDDAQANYNVDAIVTAIYNPNTNRWEI